MNRRSAGQETRLGKAEKGWIEGWLRDTVVMVYHADEIRSNEYYRRRSGVWEVNVLQPLASSSNRRGRYSLLPYSTTQFLFPMSQQNSLVATARGCESRYEGEGEESERWL